MNRRFFGKVLGMIGAGGMIPGSSAVAKLAPALTVEFTNFRHYGIREMKYIQGCFRYTWSHPTSRGPDDFVGSRLYADHFHTEGGSPVKSEDGTRQWGHLVNWHHFLERGKNQWMNAKAWDYTDDKPVFGETR